MSCNGIILGIDGGGTRTTAVAFDTDGNFLTEQTGDTVNFCAVGMEKARANMSSLISKLASVLGTDCFYSVFIGMSAIEGEATEKQLHDFCHGIINSEYIGMNSDLFIALEGMDTEGACVFTVSGTGSMTIARDTDGNIHTSGGWGYILSDLGSGYDIAVNGIKKAVRAYELGNSKTALTSSLFSRFGGESLQQLCDIFYDPPMERNKIASFCEDVCRCAESGDETAVSILDNAARELSLDAINLIKKTGSGTVGIYGGVFTHSPLFTETFKKYVTGTFPGTVVRFPVFPPQLGAVFAACRQAGLDIIKNNIKATYGKVKDNE